MAPLDQHAFLLCARTYLVLDLPGPVHRGVEVILCSVDIENGCPTVLNKAFFGCHDIEVLGYKVSLHIHDSEGGRGDVNV